MVKRQADRKYKVEVRGTQGCLFSLDYHLQQMKPRNRKHFAINKAQNSGNYRVIIILAIESKISSVRQDSQKAKVSLKLILGEQKNQPFSKEPLRVAQVSIDYVQKSPTHPHPSKQFWLAACNIQSRVSPGSPLFSVSICSFFFITALWAFRENYTVQLEESFQSDKNNSHSESVGQSKNLDTSTFQKRRSAFFCIQVKIKSKLSLEQ